MGMVVLAAVVIVACSAAPLAAQDAKEAAAASEGATTEQTFLYFLFGGGGLVGVACTVPILAASVLAMALVVEHLLMVRRSVLMPPALAQEVNGFISHGAFPHAEQQCKLRPSLLSHVILAGLQEVRQGYSAVEKAMEDACHAQAARLFRKVEFLAVVANISTMLGLFGTVVGLVIAFKRVADTQGVARASDLAGGIYLALMTTIEGLAIAIPCVAAHSIFKHRADQLVAEASLLAEYAFSGYKRDRSLKRPAEAPKPTKPGAGA